MMKREFTLTPRREIALSAITFAVISLAILPVFLAGLPCSDDTLPHFYRTVQLLVLVEQGAPFLQWGPDLMRGYGYPIMAFYAPLTYWLLAALTLPGLGVGPAMQVAFFLALYLAGLGAYLLARRYVGAVGALVAGVAYLFSPYLLYDAIQRGALPETLALAFIPWALAVADRVQERPSWRGIGLGALLFALTILTHNALPLFGLALAGLWALLPLRSITDWRDWLRQVWPVMLMLALALGLTLFFWLPALGELGDTQSRRDNPPIRDWPRFEQHLIPPAQLVGWPDEPPDPRLLNSPVSRTAGTGQVALALLGLWGVWVYPRGGRRWRLWLLAGLTAVSLLLATTPSFWAWVHVGPLNFIQLPTRFLGPASLGLALLSGVGVEALWLRLRGQVARVGLVLAAGTAVALSGLPWLYPHYCPVPANPDRLMLAQATTWPRWYAEAQGEVLPRWVDELPPADALISQYETGGPVNRLDLPPVVTLLGWQSGPGWDRYELIAETAVSLTYRSFYFPGWQGRLDGTAVSLSPATPHGLITLELPPGQHSLELAFRATPLRRIALWLSLPFALTVLGLLVVGSVSRKPYSVFRVPSMGNGTRNTVHRSRTTDYGSRITVYAPFLLLALLLPLLKLSADRIWPLLSSGPERPLSIDFSGEFTYLGYSGPETAGPERPLAITQYWAPQREIGVPYGFALYLADDLGQGWGREPVGRPFGYTHYPGDRGWRVGDYARDAYEISLLPGTPPGLYWLEAEGFRRDAAVSLLPRDWPTGLNPARARVGQVMVTAVPTPRSLAGWTRETAVVTQFAPTRVVDNLTLAGWSLPDFPLRSGDIAPLTLLWHGGARPPQLDTIQLELRDAAGQIVGGLQRPLSPAYPPEAWPAWALVREQFGWRVDPALATGEYEVWLAVDGITPIPLGPIRVEAPERQFSPPEMAKTADAPIGFARLAGYTLESESDGLHLTLLWQAAAETETRYRVFVHLRQADGSILAQSDSEPQGWTRPTTGWLPGEYVLDAHWLPLPSATLPADAQLLVGLYDPATGQRLGETLLARFGD